MSSSVVDLVVRQAGLAPGALAVAHADECVTYGDLDLRSAALAARLLAQGVGPDAVVGLYAGRCVAAVVGALGILRAGGAFLPLDPSLPGERMRLLCADAGAEVVVTAAQPPGNPFGEAVRAVALGAGGTLPAGPSLASGARELEMDGLAYVMYTSGSTGRPKGVEVTHRNLRHLVDWHGAAFDVVAADRASHLSFVGFDAAVWELWPYLSAGASVHIAGDDVAKDPAALRDWFVANGITIGFAATPLAERLLDLPWPPATALRMLLTGADTLRKYPPPTLPFRLVNNYGLTETTVVATSGIVAPATHADGLPSIGRPVAGTSVYLVDESGTRVAEGEEGELWVGGAGVALGYRRAASLTSERFLPDPFSTESGARVYRTGDRGRLLPDGRLTFLGRTDGQLKLRGFRIEAAEVEAALGGHPGVSVSAVVVRAVATGDERLVAYVVPAPQAAPSAANLRDYVAARLPSYMVPSSVVMVDDLPLTSSGKIDRTALRERDPGDAPLDEGYVAPRTPTEERLAAIVGQLLKVERVSVDDNFFMLGGHSLLATQVIARIRDAFAVSLGLRFLFESPTIAALSHEIEERTKQGVPAAALTAPISRRA